MLCIFPLFSLVLKLWSIQSLFICCGSFQKVSDSASYNNPKERNYNFVVLKVYYQLYCLCFAALVTCWNRYFSIKIHQNIWSRHVLPGHDRMSYLICLLHLYNIFIDHIK